MKYRNCTAHLNSSHLPKHNSSNRTSRFIPTCLQRKTRFILDSNACTAHSQSSALRQPSFHVPSMPCPVLGKRDDRISTTSGSYPNPKPFASKALIKSSSSPCLLLGTSQHPSCLLPCARSYPMSASQANKAPQPLLNGRVASDEHFSSTSPT